MLMVDGLGWTHNPILVLKVECWGGSDWIRLLTWNLVLNPDDDVQQAPVERGDEGCAPCISLYPSRSNDDFSAHALPLSGARLIELPGLEL